MKTPSVGLELRSLNNLICRYFHYAAHREEVKSATGNNGRIIGFLAQNAGRDVFQKDIEQHFTITRSTASRVLGLMKRKGLIEKQAVAEDARLKKIVLTQKAWKIERMMREDAQNMERTLVRGFSDTEIRTLMEFLRRMKQNISGIA